MKLIKEKSSPIHPDGKHLHMLLYKILLKKSNDKLKSNYYVSIITNLIYLILIIPAILMMKNGLIIDEGTPKFLIEKHGRKNLEEVFVGKKSSNSLLAKKKVLSALKISGLKS